MAIGLVFVCLDFLLSVSISFILSPLSFLQFFLSLSFHLLWLLGSTLCVFYLDRCLPLFRLPSIPFRNAFRPNVSLLTLVLAVTLLSPLASPRRPTFPRLLPPSPLLLPSPSRLPTLLLPTHTDAAETARTMMMTTTTTTTLPREKRREHRHNVVALQLRRRLRLHRLRIPSLS